mgnify:CR=1 FL=1
MEALLEFLYLVGVGLFFSYLVVIIVVSIWWD